MTKRLFADKFINQKLGELVVLEKLPCKHGRSVVRCKCLVCGREDYLVYFQNIKRNVYKSCGCAKHNLNSNNSRWMGHGEISGGFFCKIKHGAKSRALDFMISIEEIWNLFLKQNRKCALTGRELTFPKRLRDYSQTASLDRIDSSRGYTIDNVQWIHKDLQKIKLDSSERDFFNLIKEVYEYKRL